MDGEMLKFLASLGVGGILAGMMFFFYRRDMERHAAALAEMKTEHARAIEHIASRSDAQVVELKAIVRENTAAIAHNTDVSRAMVDAVNRIAPDVGRQDPPRPNHWKGR